MNGNRKNPTVLGFARYQLKENATVDELLERSWDFKQQFLSKQDGIMKHWLLRNLNGEYADAILAVDEESYDAMSDAYPTAKGAEGLLALLDTESIRLRKNKILKSNIKVPSGFACIEYGTFKPKQDKRFNMESLLAASKSIEENYLHNLDNTVEHFVGQIDEDTYSEVVFGKTLDQTKRTCFGYIGNPICEELLGLFDPESVDLDFWYVLA